MKTRPVFFRALLITGGLGFAVTAGAQTAPSAAAPPPPSLKDAAGRAIRRAPTGHLTNYYEDKIPPYTLPDPLVLENGIDVRDARAWFGLRRPEILRIYETQVYGRVPANAPAVRFTVVGTESVLGGRALRRHVVGRFGPKPDGPVVNLMLYLPVAAAGRLPVVLHVTFGGDPALAPPPALLPPGAAAARHFNDLGPVDEMLARGYAYAVLRYTEIQPDHDAGRTQGVIGLTLPPGRTAPAPDEWGTISAWAWGLSRVMDYLATDPAVDARRVALVGHSRLGKTVLWAAAQDPRFALVYSSQGGEMGSALSRRDFGETIDDLGANYGYQFAGNFQRYIGHWNALPVDAHLLLSLIAPRPLFVSGGSGDLWSDPHGEFLAMVAAGPVWRLLGQSDLGTTQMPTLDVPVATGTLAYLEHRGPHAITPLDWKVFLDFADRTLKRK